MAYCLRSFVETLDQVLNPRKHYKKWVLHHAHRPQIQSLFENATFLQDFLDNASPQIQEAISTLEDQIMDAAQEGADDLETVITDQILLNPKDQSFTIIPPDLELVMQVFEDAKQKLSMIKDPSQSYDQIALPHVSSTHYPDSKVVVGLEEDLYQLKDRLTCRETKLDVIPIVGMGGIGKTTLARIIYDEYSSSNSHFDRCAWVTVSQRYDPQQILKTVLACITKEENPQQHTSDLITTLHKSLFGLRYLIVLDDIWTSEAWNYVQRAFPRGNQGSRVVFTTRENSLVGYVNSTGHEMRLMNEDKSWELLRGKVFGDESCPPQLEEFGKRISLNCRGLPLALQVIGGLLANSQINQDYWNYVADNVSSLIANRDGQFAGIFSLSFAQLPHYLKPCFLYMCTFPEDHDIPALKLKKLWVSEGFLYPVPNKSLEEAAEVHLNALVDRNLIFVRKRKWNGKPYSYGIHDLLRDLCLRKAAEKKFLYVIDSKSDILKDDISRFRRVSVHDLKYDVPELVYESLKRISLVRSIRFPSTDESNEIASCLCDKSLLRVLDVDISTRCVFQEMFLHLVNLKYLDIGNYYIDIIRSYPTLSIDVSLIKNLQTLIVERLESIAILEHLPQLRNLKFQTLENPNVTYTPSFRVHENLLCVSKVPFDSLNYLLKKIPNLRKLVITSVVSNDSLFEEGVDLTCFQKLESLKFVEHYLHSSKYSLSSNIMFPGSLKKLTFSRFKTYNPLIVPPGLQCLKLKIFEFENDTWDPSGGEFCQLQYLEIYVSNLRNWLASEIHFPVLRQLVLIDLYHLSEIPNDFGEIETLETIKLDYCKASVFDSARTIHEEQRESGNTTLQLRLGRTLEDIENKEAAIELKSFERKVRNHGLTLDLNHFNLSKTIFPRTILQLRLGRTYEDWENEKAAEELEGLKQMVRNHGLRLYDWVSYTTKIIFPHTLKKLTLEGCYLNQTALTAIGVLPQLQLLKFSDCGDSNWKPITWEPSEGEFCQLQQLIILGFRHLVKWIATEIRFPILRKLVIKDCNDLSEIPIGIGRIETLEMIVVDNCKPSLFESARIILEEQRKFGNTILQLRLGRTLEDFEKEEAESQLKIFESKVQNHELTIHEVSLSKKSIFPHSLRKLELNSCEIESPTLLSAMGVLPQLEVLKLYDCQFTESVKWEPSEGEFCQLQYLKIRKCNLEKLLATEIHFPVLRHLVINSCRFLVDIPIGIGRIETLEMIKVKNCKPSVRDSARIILKEQLKIGNTAFQLQLDGELVEVDVEEE